MFTTRLYSNQYTAFSTKLTSPTVAPAPPTRAATAAAPLTQARCQEQFAVCPRRLSSSAAASARGRCTPRSPRRRPPARCSCAPSPTRQRACCSSCLSDIQKPVVKADFRNATVDNVRSDLLSLRLHYSYPAAHGSVILGFRKPPRYDLDHKRAEAVDVAREIRRSFRAAAAAVLLPSLCFGGEFTPHTNICQLHR